MNNSQEEVNKLQQRLNLLREEYVKLQRHCEEVEKERAQLRATTEAQNGTGFVAQILKAISLMYKSSDYSDLKVRFEDGEEYPAHKFVLKARNSNWQITGDDDLDWSHLPKSVGEALLEWIYTNKVSLIDKEDGFKLTLMKASKSFDLPDLLVLCERSLITSVQIRNCIKLYTTAEEIGADGLKNHCSSLISTHWDDFTSEDFEHMTAPLLFQMFKTKTKYPLHSAIRLKREDVVFLYLIEFNQQLSVKLNEEDDHGILPLDLALKSKQDELAQNLVDHNVNIDQMDSNGSSLLHLAIDRDDVFSAKFLLNHSTKVNTKRTFDENTPLHLAAQHPDMSPIAQILLQQGASTNAINIDGLTPLHISIMKKNSQVFEVLMENKALLDLQSEEGYPALWYALQDEEIFSLAEKLVNNGASSNIVCDTDGNTLLHCLILNDNEAAAIFLVNQKSNVNSTNRLGESPLHLAAYKGFDSLVENLLNHGADPNVQTVFKSNVATNSEDFRQTPLHLAISYRQSNVITTLITDNPFGDNRLKPDFNLKNSSGLSPLALALAEELQDTATELLKGGADVNVTDNEGLTLLHLSLLDENCDSALFLLNNGADVNVRTKSNQTCLEIAIEKNLVAAVEAICRLGADLSSASGLDPPMWIALKTNQDLASVLVRYGADTDCWAEGPDGCQQTLLHRAIDENNEEFANFLIRCGCDLDSPRKVGPDGRGGDEAHDLASPLHLCCQWGLEEVVRTLLEHGASKNARDVEGKTPLHSAIENGDQTTINLLLDQPGLDLHIPDKSGNTAFATAMTSKNNKAAQKILQLEPQAAEQFDPRGRNFLHTAIIKGDFESVLFLISINVNVHSRTQDQHGLTPLLLAVQKGHSMIVRNLILAGASVHDKTPSQQTALQLAAESNLAEVCGILLSEGIDYAAVDSRGNNALHIAVKEGHLDVIRVLLTESHIDAKAINFKGRNPLHILANFAQDNAVAVFDLFLECMSDYPLDKIDGDGNTALLLAYMKGNGAMCRSLVKAGATLGTLNQNGVSIFNCQVATKTLLMRLLDSLSQEPKWGEGEVCEECCTKFGITTRKHHCRHCGRLLCNKCSSKEMPIIKYNLSKAVRVCDTCAEVITVGPAFS